MITDDKLRKKQASMYMIEKIMRAIIREREEA